MASPSLTYTLTNGTSADADQVMQNFNDIINGITDGTKDLSIAALTAAGTATFNGNVTLGNATADDITVTGSLASSIPIKTDASFDIGTSSLGLRKAYFGGNSQRVSIGASGSTAATYDLTLPTNVPSGSGYKLVGTTSGVLSWDYEDSGTFTANFTGPQSKAVTVAYTRTGKTVVLHFPEFSGTSGSSTNFTASASVPSAIRPTTEILMSGPRCTTGSTTEAGRVGITTGGNITISENMTTGSFVSGSAYTVYGFSLAYTVA